ncbi:hypothetical protein [Paraburkholderia sp. J41]|uniref:hypothetical protein n=1 Tax=Paraburkholderia sp. J41 TaxID=2805433 RepID=UPI002AC32C8B|nr:hypothetical protein [Paraburkholderia sp. J41]
MHERQLRAIHAQACAAVALVDRTITPIDEQFWPLYLSAALAAVEPEAPQAVTLSDEQRVRVRDAIAEAIGGDAYDCMRVWSEWGVGTMSADDFHCITDDGERLSDIADAAINALLAANPTEQRMSDAERDVLAERARQVNEEGWTPEHDDAHRPHEMSCAAGCYAMYTLAYPAGDPPPQWPWHAAWWKPTTHRRNLIKACALLLAEIERIDRDPGDESIHHHTRGGDQA